MESGREGLLEAYQPFLEGDFGRGRLLQLSKKRCQWRNGWKARPLLLDLSRLSRVRLERRRAWESLIFAAVFGTGVLLAASTAARFICAALLGLAVVAALAQRKYSLHFDLKDGTDVAILLGIGTRRSLIVRRIESIWDSFSLELERLGIATVPSPLGRGCP